MYGKDESLLDGVGRRLALSILATIKVLTSEDKSLKRRERVGGEGFFYD